MAHFSPRSLAVARSLMRIRRVAGPPYSAVTSGASDIVVSLAVSLEAAIAVPGFVLGSTRSSHQVTAGRQGSVEDLTGSRADHPAWRRTSAGADRRTRRWVARTATTATTNAAPSAPPMAT